MPPLQQAAIALVPLRGVRGKAAPKRLAQIKKFKFRQSAYGRCSIPKRIKVVILLNCMFISVTQGRLLRATFEVKPP